MKIVVRTMQVSDLPQVVAIENSWSYLSKWGEEGYMRVLRDPRIYMCLVAEDLEAEGPQGHSLLAGLAVLALLVDFCELCNLVVEPSYISKKVGYQLLRNCFEISQHQGISRMFLEVRASNARAIAFYKANGFKIISQRRNYYRNPTEDAWVMERRNPDIKPETKDSGHA